MFRIPDPRKNRIGKPYGLYIPHHFLPQVVVDPVNVIRLEKAFHLLIQLFCRCQIFTKRLLQNHFSMAGMFHMGQSCHNGRKKSGGNRKIEYMAFCLHLFVKLVELCIGFFIRKIHLIVENACCQPVIIFFRVRQPGKFFHPVPGDDPVLLTGIISSADDDHLSHRFPFARHGHIVERRKQFPESQVTGASEYGKCEFFIHIPAPIHDGRCPACQPAHRCGHQNNPSVPESDWPPRAFL